MSKFNLKESKKQDGDTHTNVALQDQHVVAPEQITDKQLEKAKHTDTIPESITEKQLDSVRAEDEGRTIEGRLNQNKAKFDIKHRNESAYTGDINKVEEKRLAGDKVEDEKYQLAADTNKTLRWWETKTNDGLKLAMSKLAQVDTAIERPISKKNSPDELDVSSDSFAVNELMDTPSADSDFPINESPVGEFDDGLGEDEGTVDFTEVDFGDTDVGGTNVLMGKIQIGDGNVLEKEALMGALEEFIHNKHPDLFLSEDSIELDANGESATFFMSRNKPEASNDMSSESGPKNDFQILHEPSDAPVQSQEEAFDVVGDMNHEPLDDRDISNDGGWQLAAKSDKTIVTAQQEPPKDEKDKDVKKK